MSNASNASIAGPDMAARMAKRRAAESRFRFYGRASVLFALTALGWLLVSIFATGLSAFTQHWVTLDLDVAQAGDNDRRALAEAMAAKLEIPANTLAADGALRRDLLSLISASAATAQMRQRETGEGTAGRMILTVPLSDRSNRYFKGRIDLETPETQRLLSDRQAGWLDAWAAQGRVDRRFASGLFANPDSRDPERAGLASALFGSVMIVLISGALAIPVGIGAAVYLDGFAPRTGWGGHMTRMLEVSINNLAAVPAIVFGLLGLAIFINVLGLARSIPLVGGLVMALRMFPTVVIASRAALQAVPDSLTDSALSLGASRMQAMFGHKVPVAAPAMLTGSIIGMAQALGETAPLLMIGMVAFVTAIPDTPLDPATALPVQIFLWSGSAETAWAERASAAIIVLLAVLMLINGVAVVLRERLQRRTS
ncbi:MAG: DUF3333 domain-containing protein [Pseudomonadota bacterium]